MCGRSESGECSQAQIKVHGHDIGVPAGDEDARLSSRISEETVRSGAMPLLTVASALRTDYDL
jgi:hypothetical protein